MSGPSAVELVLHMLELQPEIDEASAVRILRYDDDIRLAVEANWRNNRQLGSQLLEWHMILDERAAA